jgi:23S rRNA G2069 N7-methylase RlmK/C1962 C5-methylase RlmI
MAKGKDFLNLFSYTGSFTCAAALGDARSTVTVDRSGTYLDWARDNLKLNNLFGPQHTMARSDATFFLAKAFRERQRFTLAFVDPPSFFHDKKRDKAMDVNEAHPQLLRDVLKVMVPGSTVFFSCNHQRFEPNLEGLPVKELVEITPKTIPEDYRNKKIHRCWRMIAA